MRLRAPVGLLLAAAVALTAGLPPAVAQIDTEEERDREAAREREIEKKMAPWQYELYKRQRDRNKLKDRTELDRLVDKARLFPLVGKDPPPFTLLRPDGRRVGLSDFAGQVVLLYFWTTAGASSDDLPVAVEKLQRELGQRRFIVVAVNVRDKKEEVASWIQSKSLSPVFLLDPDGGVAELYRVRAAPTAYLIGRDHKLVGRVTGTRAWDDAASRELLDYLLKAPTR